MKKTLLLLLTPILFHFGAIAQSIPNGGFENWTGATYNTPNNFIGTSNTQAYFGAGAAFNVVKVADPFHGSYAMQLTTVQGTNNVANAYAVNFNASGGNPASWTGGIPYNQMATGIHGNYKSAIPSGDTAHIIVNFKSGGSSIGFYIFNFYGNHNSYTPFQFNFTLGGTPDTVMFGAASSDFINNVSMVGSMLQLDSISFTGVASQPAMMNGDFENWTPTTIYSLDNWYQNGGGNNGSTILQSTDAYAGQYAMELVTYQGDRNGHPVAQAASAGTGYYVCPNGGGMCSLHGGYPFANMVDTLAFYYKYAPANPSDSALVNLTYKYNGSQTFGTGKYLFASANYQYVELPINTMTAVDSLVVQFQSSSWQDSSLVFVGSDLKVDDVHLKSSNQAVGIFKYAINGDMMSIAPNPFTSQTIITFAEEQKNSALKVTDVLGNVVFQTTINSRQFTIDMSSYAKGIYFVNVTNESKSSNKKIVLE